jgi:hypothetical protein
MATRGGWPTARWPAPPHTRLAECATLWPVILADESNSLAITVVGYQFPDATDPEQRFSWHMVDGEASCPDGAWRFRSAALTCDESPMIGMWLTALAGWLENSEGEAPDDLGFIEPSLRFRAGGLAGPNKGIVEVDVDLEFKPPWARTTWAGEPYTLRVVQDADALRRAAAAWFSELEPYPDGLDSHR